MIRTFAKSSKCLFYIRGLDYGKPIEILKENGIYGSLRVWIDFKVIDANLEQCKTA